MTLDGKVGRIVVDVREDRCEPEMPAVLEDAQVCGGICRFVGLVPKPVRRPQRVETSRWMPRSIF